MMESQLWQQRLQQRTGWAIGCVGLLPLGMFAAARLRRRRREYAGILLDEAGVQFDDTRIAYRDIKAFEDTGTCLRVTPYDGSPVQISYDKKEEEIAWQLALLIRGQIPTKTEDRKEVRAQLQSLKNQPKPKE